MEGHISKSVKQEKLYLMARDKTKDTNQDGRKCQVEDLGGVRGKDKYDQNSM